MPWGKFPQLVTKTFRHICEQGQHVSVLQNMTKCLRRRGTLDGSQFVNTDLEYVCPTVLLGRDAHRTVSPSQQNGGCLETTCTEHVDPFCTLLRSDDVLGLWVTGETELAADFFLAWLQEDGFHKPACVLLK